MEALRREHDQYEAFYRSVPKTMALFIGSLLLKIVPFGKIIFSGGRSLLSGVIMTFGLPRGSQ